MKRCNIDEKKFSNTILTILLFDLCYNEKLFGDERVTSGLVGFRLNVVDGEKELRLIMLRI